MAATRHGGSSRLPGPLGYLGIPSQNEWHGAPEGNAQPASDNAQMHHTPDATPLHPFATLTPDVVLDALASVGLYGDGRLMALSSYENRVYQVTLEDGERVVAKFYRPGRWSEAQILEEHAFAAELMAAEVPAVGPLVLAGRTLHPFGGFQFSVSPWRGGRQPELDDFEVLEWIGRFLARIHTVGAARPFTHRPALDLQGFGAEPRDWLLEHELIPLDVQSAWRDACKTALDLIASSALQESAGGQFLLKDATLLRLHGDCHAGNVLWTDAGPHFVDFDDSRMGPGIQDLWMLLSGSRAEMQSQLTDILVGYEDFLDFDARQLHLIEALRTLRLLHYSAWLAQRWDDPAFPAAFPWFNSQRYWQDRILELREQIALMDEAPLWPV